MKIFNLITFTSQEILTQIRENRELVQYFSIEMSNPSDHIGDKIKCLNLYNETFEIDFCVYNDFHYKNDFEIGFMIEKSETIEGFRCKLMDAFFDFEDGYLNEDGKNIYYLIPKKNSTHTPFFFLMDTDSGKDKYLTGISGIEIIIEKSSYKISKELLEIIDPENKLNIKLYEGNQNRFNAIKMKPTVERIKNNEIIIEDWKFTVTENELIISDKE